MSGDSEMFLTEAEVHSERTGCLSRARSVSVILGDTSLREHSDEEWYPPTPPLYDVTDKLR